MFWIGWFWINVHPNFFTWFCYQNVTIEAIEGSNKELITTIKKENEETRATIRKENKERRETLQKIAEDLQETLVERKKNEACENPVLKNINECTSQTVSLFTYWTKARQNWCRCQNAKRNINSF